MPREAPAYPVDKHHYEGDLTRKRINLTNDFAQAGQRYRSLSKVDQDHLIGNISDSLSKADKPIQKRMIENLIKADPELGKRVAKALKE
jgi:catalase